jgi:hypothetical protein
LGHRVLDVLNKPLFGTVVAPPNAVVDPRLFPEEEFPIWCERCGYSLTQLPDGRCPECGRAFTRARALIVEYVVGPQAWRRRWLWSRRRRSRSQRIGAILVAAGLVPVAIGGVGVPLVDVLVPVGPSRQTPASELLEWARDSFGRWGLAAFLVICVGLLSMYVAGAVLSAVQSADLRRKRKRVTGAITVPAKKCTG